MNNESLKIAIKEYYNSLSKESVIKEFKKGSLLNCNTKLQKQGEALGYYLQGLELMPERYTPGKNLCPLAGECSKTCLAFSGHARLIKDFSKLNDTLKKRIRRTFLYKEASKEFFEILSYDIKTASLKALKNGLELAIRLNVFSDVDFSNFIKEHSNIFFYDYTKVWSRKELPNYFLTYSASEKTSKEAIFKKLSENSNVALVFPFHNELPKTLNGFNVINGNVHDLRFLDMKGSIIGLTQKQVIGFRKDQTNNFINVGINL